MDCDEEREGYVNQPRVAYPVIHAPESKQRGRHQPGSTRGEEGFGALIVVCGAMWAAYEVIYQGISPWQLQLYPVGPVEIGALGVLIWLHAKWRRSAKI